jgi:hypothetical protein
MAVISRQLATVVTAVNVWTQLTEGVGGSDYSVPSSGSNPRSDFKLFRAINNSAGSTTIALAISASSPSSVAYEIWPHYAMNPNTQQNDDSVHVARAGEKVWAKVITDSSGSTTSVIWRASLMEWT